MPTYNREIVQSPLNQGADEQIAYTLTTTPWGSSPTSVAVTLFSYSGTAYTDVSSTLLSGTASVSGDIITLPKVINLVADTRYRLEIKFTSGSNIFEPYAWINGER